ncbi:MAG: tryptophan 7-halogenase [Thiolinea sp.]
MEHKPVRLVIVGGGTAGWLAALLLQAEGKRQGLHLDITLIESSRVPTIGVGEGTTAIFGAVLQALGIPEAEFLAHTDATIKYGIRHRDWRRLGHYYDGPIDDAYALAERLPAAGSWLDTFCVAAGRSVAEPHVFTALMAGNKAPVAQVQGRQIPVSHFQHAYHFDQAKVGAYLRSKAGKITTLDALVQAAERDPKAGRSPPCNWIMALSARRFLYRLHRLPAQPDPAVMDVPWVSYGEALPISLCHALSGWTCRKISPAHLHPRLGATGRLAVADSHQGRIGCGYVYSDRHISPEQAQAEIETRLGHAIEPRNDIRINVGRLEQVWCGNVLALGLASSFLEPLEATSIHGTVVALLLFAQHHLATLTGLNPGAGRFQCSHCRAGG